MKKLALFLALMFFTFGNAQVKFGINGGFSSAVVSNEFEDLRAGFYAGIFSEIGIPGLVKLQPALNYVRFKDDSYVQIPVMLKFYFVPRVNLQAGPQFAFRLEDVPDSVNRTNFGVGVGLGADLFSGLLIEARYAFQLNSAFKNSPSGAKVHFNLFNVGLGLRL